MARDAYAPPEIPSLHSSRVTLSQALEVSYWRTLCPELHVCDDAFVSSAAPLRLPAARLAQLRTELDTAGFTRAEPDELTWKPVPADLAAAVTRLMRHGWPPSVLLLYDEPWVLMCQAAPLMAAATGGNAVNMDALVWHVDPSNGDAGFSPHRDRQPDDAASSFRADGSAKYSTLWLALTAATPDNSCLHVIPRHIDPGYVDGDPDDDDAPDPLARALSCKEAYQHIRALPADPGAALVFTHRTIHWGSAVLPPAPGTRPAPLPRVSISWGCADDAFEPPYFSRRHLPCPPLALRLGLLGAQMITYHERFPATPRLLRLYYEAFKAVAAELDGTYAAKVRLEFVGASKEATVSKCRSGKEACSDARAVSHTSSRSKGSTCAGSPVVGVSKKSGVRKGRASSRGGSNGAKQHGDGMAAVTADGAAGRQGALRRRAAAKAGAVAASPQLQRGAGAPSQQAKRRRGRTPKPGGAGTVPGSVHASDGEDGEPVDWEAIRAAALAGAARPKQATRANGSCAAATHQSDGSDGGDDVMDLALDAMLDGEEGDWQDDYDDDDA